MSAAEQHFQLTADEIEVLRKHPVALSILMDHHEYLQSQAECVYDADECPRGNEIRRRVIYERGRSIIAEDIDIWHDAVRKDFGFPVAG